MKILFFSRLFFPHIGGVETHVYHLAKELINKGHTITVVTELFDKKLKKYEKIEGIHVFRIPLTEINKKGIIWAWLWKNRQLVEEADIIHAHDVAFWFFPFRLLYPYKKFFTTFHGYEGNFPVSKKAIIVRKISEYISKGKIGVGEFIKKWYGTNLDYVIYGGVDTLQIANRKSRIQDSKLKIIYVGRMDSDMGIPLYCEVLQKLKEKKVQFEFISIGDGDLRKEFEPYGTVTGFVKDINVHIEKADVIFASSYLTILESLALKKKVVSVYTNPLKKDYLTMTPFAKFICISQNSDEIIKYIQSDNSFNKELEDFIAGLTWEKVSETYINLWKK